MSSCKNTRSLFCVTAKHPLIQQVSSKTEHKLIRYLSPRRLTGFICRKEASAAWLSDAHWFTVNRPHSRERRELLLVRSLEGFCTIEISASDHRTLVSCRQSEVLVIWWSSFLLGGVRPFQRQNKGCQTLEQFMSWSCDLNCHMSDRGEEQQQPSRASSRCCPVLGGNEGRRVSPPGGDFL